ncbi:MAG: CRISPR-associated RAMP protein Csx7 [candidate division WOR-3 bacterium]
MSETGRLAYYTLERLVVLEGYVETLTALHIGKGRALDADAASDLPVMKDPFSLPFIPGSSLKGVLRSYTESLVRGLDGGKLKSCDPVGQVWTGCVDPGKFSQQQKRGVPQGEQELRVPEDICDVCDLFGHPNFASRLRFADLPVDQETWHELLLQVRDGVAIDRETSTVARPMKYDFEVVPAGVHFKLKVAADNVEDWQLGLFFAAVDALNSGFNRLGGSTSRGLGSVTIRWQKYRDLTANDIIAGKAEEKTDVANFRTGCGKRLQELLNSGRK